MDQFARVKDGAVVELREFASEPDPNPAKGLDWRPVPAKPTIDPDYQELTLTANGGALTWVVGQLPLATVQATMKKRIKREAERRILAIVPEWKQRNLIAQASMLAEKGRANWTDDELAAWNVGTATWTIVAAIRSASDVAEKAVTQATDAATAHNAYTKVVWP